MTTFSLKVKVLLWVFGSALISWGVYLYTTNPEWNAMHHMSYFLLIWGVVFVSCPSLWWFKNQSTIDGYEIGFSTLFGLNLVAISFLNPFLPQIEIYTFPLLSWHRLPSYEAYVVCLALVPTFILAEVVLYVASSAFFHAIKTKTLF